jgi:hypothetical protein
MKTVRILMVAEIRIRSAEDPTKALTRLDQFRERVLPSERWGITLYRATPEDLKEVGPCPALVVMEDDVVIEEGE